jgi:hypothetical protein
MDHTFYVLRFVVATQPNYLEFSLFFFVERYNIWTWNFQHQQNFGDTLCEKVSDFLDATKKYK